jgi:hypothetical protein
MSIELTMVGKDKDERRVLVNISNFDYFFLEVDGLTILTKIGMDVGMMVKETPEEIKKKTDLEIARIAGINSGGWEEFFKDPSPV